MAAAAVATAAAGACANPTIPIVFSPMYSAYIPGSTAQVFSIPAVTTDGNTATWSLSDPTQGNLQPQTFANGSDMLQGVMITISGTGDSNGDVTVIATESGGACGSAVLHITKQPRERLDHRQRPLQRRRLPPRRRPRG